MRCSYEPFSIGTISLEKDLIDLSPVYQRQSGVWGIEQKQLFLHSIFAKYDVPKIYLHKLPRGGQLKYALVDGKQRLHCIWSFMNNEIPLGEAHERFVHYEKAPRGELPFPLRGNLYKDLSVHWKEEFKKFNFHITIIEKADEHQIEDLFSRLNNGEPLFAPEKRNAFGGNMCRLIPKVARHKFFDQKTGVLHIPAKSLKRYQNYDIAARFLLIEESVNAGGHGYCTLKKVILDKFVKKNRTTGEDEINRYHKAVKKQLNALCKVFSKKDPLLKQAAHPQMYYLFVKEIERQYAHKDLFSLMSEFVKEFQVLRNERRDTDPEQRTEDRHRYFEEFDHHMRQANDKGSLEKRVSIMTQYFLLEYPDVKNRDVRETFSLAERYVIWFRGGKKCANAKCGAPLNFSESQADHIVQWAHGGKTSLKNAQALCLLCNSKKNERVA